MRGGEREWKRETELGESSSVLLSNSSNNRACLSLVALNWGALRGLK